MASEGFFERVYEVVEQIPEGMVATYGQVALLAGRPRSARYVGYALHSNPRPGEIPCHRVVFADDSNSSFVSKLQQRCLSPLWRFSVVGLPRLTYGEAMAANIDATK